MQTFVKYSKITCSGALIYVFELKQKLKCLHIKMFQVMEVFIIMRMALLKCSNWICIIVASITILHSLNVVEIKTPLSIQDRLIYMFAIWCEKTLFYII